MEKTQRELRDRLAMILENITDAFVVLVTRWNYIYVNGKAAEIFGRLPEDLVGRHIWTEFPEGIGKPFYHAYYKAVNERRFIDMEDYYPR